MDQDFMKQHRKNFGQREGKSSSNTKTQRNILMILVGSLKVGGLRGIHVGIIYFVALLKNIFPILE